MMIGQWFPCRATCTPGVTSAVARVYVERLWSSWTYLKKYKLILKKYIHIVTESELKPAWRTAKKSEQLAQRKG